MRTSLGSQMSPHTPPYRQAFRIYDPSEADPNVSLDQRFQLVVAAPHCAVETEVALGQLFYSHTGIGVDWIDITDLVGASRQTAYGFAHIVSGYGTNSASVQAVIADRHAIGDRNFIVMQMFSSQEDSHCKLQIVDNLECAVKASAGQDCAFEFNMGCGGEANTVVIGFPRV